MPGIIGDHIDRRLRAVPREETRYGPGDPG